jgi:hypothetical protein
MARSLGPALHVMTTGGLSSRATTLVRCRSWNCAWVCEATGGAQRQAPNGRLCLSGAGLDRRPPRRLGVGSPQRRAAGARVRAKWHSPSPRPAVSARRSPRSPRWKRWRRPCRLSSSFRLRTRARTLGSRSFGAIVRSPRVLGRRRSGIDPPTIDAVAGRAAPGRRGRTRRQRLEEAQLRKRRRRRLSRPAWPRRAGPSAPRSSPWRPGAGRGPPAARRRSGARGRSSASRPAPDSR